MATAIALSTATTTTAIAQSYSTTGRWTWVNAAQWDKMNGTTLVSGGGTHMALLHGNADSSWVLHWHDGTQARLWLTKPWTIRA